jgi:hypothetical protein
MPPGTNIPEAYSRGSDEDQAFVQNLAIFLTAFFRAHLGWVPACLPACPPACVGWGVVGWGVRLCVEEGRLRAYVDKAKAAHR